MPDSACKHSEMKSSGYAAVYLLMVYPISNYQRFKNAVMKSSSILQNYTGMLVCTAPEVKVIEGTWPPNRTMAIFHFDSEKNCKQWLHSDPVVKQPDFLDGVDCVIVHMKEILPTEKKFFVIADVKVHDPESFINEYSPKTSMMKERGKVVVTASCPEPIRYKGTWKPNMIIVNQWASESDYLDFYRSAEYQPLKELRQRITESNVLSLSDC